MSNFYVVATPIGNMGDITFRALDVLQNADLILCEDTRETRKILEKYNIHKPTISYHARSKLSKTDKIIEMLVNNKNIALVSDAGTPGISDPGALLISKIKEEFKKNNGDLKVIPIPGASAVIAALSASGLPTHEFVFMGYMPHKKGRETLFKEIRDQKRTVVFYESPHRIIKTLESLVKFCPAKNLSVAREMTKIYEEFVNGTPVEVLNYFQKNKDKGRGEFTVIVA